MNRRLRASELSLHEVAQNVAPFRPHVETSPGTPSKAELPPSAVPGVSLERQRAEAVDALHTYIVAACQYDHRRSMTILNRVLTTLNNQLAATPRAEQDRRR